MRLARLAPMGGPRWPLFARGGAPAKLVGMARTATHAAATLALIAALPVLPACAALEPAAVDTSNRLPNFGWPSPRMRAPSAERPAWLPSLPADPPRIPAPDYVFRA